MELFYLEPDSDRLDEIKYYTYTWQYRAAGHSLNVTSFGFDSISS
jgi:hypothetical protein